MESVTNKVFSYIDNHGKMITEEDLFIIQYELNIRFDDIKKTINELLQKHKLVKIYFDETSGSTRLKQSTGYEVDAYIVNMNYKSDNIYDLMKTHNFKMVE